MSQKLIDLTGLRFGRLLVSGLDLQRHGYWLAVCDCGSTTSVRGNRLRDEKTKSCGCLARELARTRNRTHGASVGGTMSPTYRSWSQMIVRCTNSNHDRYKDYGGRGITVCNQWLQSFAQFLSDMGERPSLKYSIDRINNDGNYEPTNCRWATRQQQARNSRSNRFLTFRGETAPLIVWAERLGFNKITLQSRLEKHGWSVEQALSTPTLDIKEVNKRANAKRWGNS